MARSTNTDPPGLLSRDGLIDSETLAGWLNVPVGTLDQWASRGGGPRHIKVGKYRRYHPADVRAWLAEQRGGDDTSVNTAVVRQRTPHRRTASVRGRAGQHEARPDDGGSLPAA